MATYNDDELGDLLDKAKWESVPVEEISQLAQQLRFRQLPEKQMYTALHIVARAGGREYENLISGFLTYESSPMLARLALQALCDWLEVCESYRDELVEFIRWVPWDHSDDVRQMAIAQAGKYLASRKDAALLQLLIDLAEDQAEMAITRDDAIRALARALCDPRESLPVPSQIQDPKSPWSQDVLVRARRRLEEEVASEAAAPPECP